jgi:uncharacterized protein YcbX
VDGYWGECIIVPFYHLSCEHLKQGRFLTQRQNSRLAFIKPVVISDQLLRLTADDSDSIDIPLVERSDPNAALCTVGIWSDTVEGAIDQGDRAALWLSSFLREEGLRLVYMVWL